MIKHILGQKASLISYKRIKMMPYLLLCHTEIKLEDKRKTKEATQIHRDQTICFLITRLIFLVQYIYLCVCIYTHLYMNAGSTEAKNIGSPGSSS